MIAQRYLILGGVALVTAIVALVRSASGKTGKPARAMSIGEATDEMRRLARLGAVDIISEGPRMIVGGKIGGVQHTYLDSTGLVPRSRIDNLDPRFGVLLVRLDQLLKALGVAELVDLGITHGGGNPQDVHNQGRAIDIAGLRGPKTDLSVLQDWGQRPEKPGVYRLGRSDKGYALFRAIYDFGGLEGADRNTLPQGGLPTRIGQASYLVTPDHPNPKLRADHKNHIHLQLGRTVGVEP